MAATFGTERPFLAILVFFAGILLLSVLEKLGWYVRHRRKRRLIYALIGTVPEVLLLFLLTAYWWLLFPGSIFVAIGAWWIGASAWP